MLIQELTLIGFGAIGRSVYQRMLGHAGVRITHIVVSPAKVAALQAELGLGVTVTHQVPVSTPLVLECAGHTALTAHVLPALRRGTECAVL
jgi:aspartate dehydrogenase